MSKNAIETILGAAVLGVTVTFAAYTLNTTQTSGGDSYPVEAAFLKIGGLQKGADVRMNGIKVGTVTDSRLDAETYDAMIDMQIRKDVRLPADTVASIVSGGILGGKYVRLEPGGERENFVAEGGRIAKTRDFQSLEDQVGEIIFLATGGGEGE